MIGDRNEERKKNKMEMDKEFKGIREKIVTIEYSQQSMMHIIGFPKE